MRFINIIKNMNDKVAHVIVDNGKPLYFTSTAKAVSHAKKLALQHEKEHPFAPNKKTNIMVTVDGLKNSVDNAGKFPENGAYYAKKGKLIELYYIN